METRGLICDEPARVAGWFAIKMSHAVQQPAASQEQVLSGIARCWNSMAAFVDIASTTMLITAALLPASFDRIHAPGARQAAARQLRHSVRCSGGSPLQAAAAAARSSGAVARSSACPEQVQARPQGPPAQLMSGAPPAAACAAPPSCQSQSQSLGLKPWLRQGMRAVAAAGTSVRLRRRLRGFAAARRRRQRGFSALHTRACQTRQPKTAATCTASATDHQMVSCSRPCC